MSGCETCVGDLGWHAIQESRSHLSGCALSALGASGSAATGVGCEAAKGRVARGAVISSSSNSSLEVDDEGMFAGPKGTVA